MSARSRFSISLNFINETSLILSVNYTGRHDSRALIVPLQWHGNTPNRARIPHELALYGAVLKGRRRRGSPAQVNIRVEYVHQTVAAPAWASLVSAFEAFTSSRFDHVVIPANVAVEIATECMLERLLKGCGVARKRLEGFFQMQITAIS